MEENVVRIFDTTLRDGEQAPGNAMTPEEKLRLARQLDALGVDVIEAGFPAASDGDFRGVRAVAEEVRRPALAALARLRRLLYRLFDRNPGARRRPLLSSNAQQQDEQEDDEHELIHDNVPISWSA